APGKPPAAPAAKPPVSGAAPLKPAVPAKPAAAPAAKPAAPSAPAKPAAATAKPQAAPAARKPGGAKDKKDRKDRKSGGERKNKIGQVLVDLGYIEEDQLFDLAGEAMSTGQTVEQCALSRGLITEDQVVQAISEATGLKVVNLEEIKPQSDALTL